MADTASVTVPAVSEDYTLSEIGLTLTDPALSYDRFETICYMLGALHEAVRFAIGDAIVQGEHLFGESAYQAFERFQLSEEAMKEYVRVAQRVPRSRRRKGLSWSHHRAVASMGHMGKDGQWIPDAKAQKEWLARAVDEGMSHHDMRAALRNGTPDPEFDCCPTCGKRL